MDCPLCSKLAIKDDVWTDKEDCTIVDYRCEDNHLTQLITPQMWITVLVLNDDGDEFYQLHFKDNNIVKVLDWSNNSELDLEGTNVEREACLC